VETLSIYQISMDEVETPWLTITAAAIRDRSFFLMDDAFTIIPALRRVYQLQCWGYFLVSIISRAGSRVYGMMRCTQHKDRNGHTYVSASVNNIVAVIKVNTNDSRARKEFFAYKAIHDTMLSDEANQECEEGVRRRRLDHYAYAVEHVLDESGECQYVKIAEDGKLQKYFGEVSKADYVFPLSAKEHAYSHNCSNEFSNSWWKAFEFEDKMPQYARTCVIMRVGIALTGNDKATKQALRIAQDELKERMSYFHHCGFLHADARTYNVMAFRIYDEVDGVEQDDQLLRHDLAVDLNNNQEDPLFNKITSHHFLSVGDSPRADSHSLSKKLPYTGTGLVNTPKAKLFESPNGKVSDGYCSGVNNSSVKCRVVFRVIDLDLIAAMHAGADTAVVTTIVGSAQWLWMTLPKNGRDKCVVMAKNDGGKVVQVQWSKNEDLWALDKMIMDRIV